MKEEFLRLGLSKIPVPSPTLPPATNTNAWILGKAKVTVVDPAGVQTKIRNQLAKVLSNRQVEAIILTHHHRDHIGGAVHLAAATGAKISCSKYTATKLPFDVDQVIHHDDELLVDGETWKAVLTPGHTRGHLCLFSGSFGDLIAGDMVA